MADTSWAAFSSRECRPYAFGAATDLAMIEFLFIYQLARNPLQAIARRWYCRGLYKASRGRRQCPGTGS
jgi:hypothetical protein